MTSVNKLQRGAYRLLLRLMDDVEKFLNQDFSSSAADLLVSRLQETWSKIDRLQDDLISTTEDSEIEALYSTFELHEAKFRESKLSDHIKNHSEIKYIHIVITNTHFQPNYH